MAKTPRHVTADEIDQVEHADGGTRRPENPDAEGRIPLPEELTGRASGTDEDLVALFDNASDKHMTDGFRGGTADEPPVDDEELENDPRQAGP